MPIQNLTTQVKRVRNPVVGLRYLGSINKGAKRTQAQIDKKQPGPDLDYFRFAPVPELNLDGVLEILYGKNPTVIEPVFLWGSTPEEAMPNWYEQRGQNGKRVMVRCDGAQREMWVDEQGKSRGIFRGDAPIPCAGDNGVCALCKPSADLYFYLPGVTERLGREGFGYWQLHFGSPQEIERVHNILTRLAEIGPVSRFALRLSRSDAHAGWRSFKNEKGETSTVEVRKSLIMLEPTGDTVDQYQRRLLQAATSVPLLPASAEDPALPAPQPHPIDDVVDGVFHESNDPPVIEWTHKQASEWVKRWEAKGISQAQLLAALNITTFGMWTQGAAAADKVVGQYIEREMTRDG